MTATRPPFDWLPRWSWRVAALVLATGSCFGHADAAPPSAVGLWQVDDGRGLIEIYPCGASLCGRVARVDVAGAPVTDIHNPDPAARDRRLCGLQIIGGFVRDRDVWTDGWIYDPEHGQEYGFEVEALPDGYLRVRGWAGLRFFGETHVWSRAPAGTVPCFGAPDVTAVTTTAPVP